MTSPIRHFLDLVPLSLDLLFFYHQSLREFLFHRSAPLFHKAFSDPSFFLVFLAFQSGLKSIKNSRATVTGFDQIKGPPKFFE